MTAHTEIYRTEPDSKGDTPAIIIIIIIIIIITHFSHSLFIHSSLNLLLAALFIAMGDVKILD